MPPGRYAGTEYMPTEEELMALEQELAAQEAAPSPGLGGGSYEAVPAPLSADTAPPPAAAAPAPAVPPPIDTSMYSAPIEPRYQPSGTSYLPSYSGSESVPPPPTSASVGTPTLDWLSGFGSARDAAVASPVGQAIGGIMSTPLPFADQLGVSPPTAIGGYLAQGQPGAAANLLGEVASSAAAHPIETASLLVGGPLARGAFGIGRGLLAGGVSRAGALSTLRDAAALAGVAAPLGITAWLTKDLNTDTGGPTTPATTTTPAGSTNITGSGSAASRPASSTPVSATQTTQTTQTAPASAPARSSSPPAPGATDSTSLLSFDAEAPFTAADFQGRLGDLPELRNIDRTTAQRMANAANARLRRRRGKRGFPFSLSTRQFHDVIRESVTEALASSRGNTPRRSKER